jgi:hypothetical protein
LLYGLGDAYNDRLVAATPAGLARLVRRILLGTKQLPNFTATAEIAGVVDHFQGHYARALATQRRFDAGVRGCWSLLHYREAITRVVDPETLDAIDTTLANYVWCTLLSPETLLSDTAPGLAEWWFETEDPLSMTTLTPASAGPVSAALFARLRAHLGTTEIVVTAFDELQQPLIRGTSGTFLVRRCTEAR